MSCFDRARLLPEKLTVYTTLVGLLNARNYNFGGEFVEAMIRQLKETLKANLYTDALYLVSVWCHKIIGPQIHQANLARVSQKQLQMHFNNV